jgi:hypothetical protein
VLLGLGALLVSPSTTHAQCRFPDARNGRSLTYRFAPDVTPDGLVMHVTLELQADASGTTPLTVPAHWTGETLHATTNLRARSSAASLAEGPTADTRILHGPPNRPVVIAYDLTKDWNGPLVHPLQFHPVLLPEYL